MPSSITLPQYSITIPDIPESQWPQTLSSLYGMPSPLEVAAINETVGAAESSILKIQSSILETKQQMSRLEILLRELSNREDGLHASIYHHKALTAPIRRVPAEILTLIFKECVDWRTRGLKRENEPLCIAQVCHRWRSIALRTAILWSKINLAHDITWQKCIWIALSNNAYHHSSESYFRRTKTWLERSGRELLSVSIPKKGYSKRGWGAHYDCDDNDQLLSQALKALSPSCDRWDNLTMEFYSIMDVAPVLLRISHSLPLLRHLHIRSEEKPSIGWTFSAFKTLPALRSLVLDGVLPQQLNIPLFHITHFCCGPSGLSIDDCVEILQGCRALISCHLYLDNLSELPNTNFEQTQIRLDHLQIFHISAKYSVNGILDCLHFPRLHTASILCFDAEINQSENIMLGLHRMISHFSSSLEKLIWGIPLAGITASFEACLRMLPQLSELDLRVEPDPEVFKMLTSSSDNSDATSCPKLRKISLRNASNFQKNGALVKMIVSRQVAFGPVGQLHTVRLHRSLGELLYLPNVLSRLMMTHHGLDVRSQITPTLETYSGQPLQVVS